MSLLDRVAKRNKRAANSSVDFGDVEFFLIFIRWRQQCSSVAKHVAGRWSFLGAQIIERRARSQAAYTGLAETSSTSPLAYRPKYLQCSFPRGNGNAGQVLHGRVWHRPAAAFFFCKTNQKRSYIVPSRQTEERRKRILDKKSEEEVRERRERDWKKKEESRNRWKKGKSQWASRYFFILKENRPTAMGAIEKKTTNASVSSRNEV